MNKENLERAPHPFYRDRLPFRFVFDVLKLMLCALRFTLYALEFTLCALIRSYQAVISPVLPRHCRFYPSCSEYSLEALKKYGALHGSLLALCRIMRCHPWSLGGYDPVVEKGKRELRPRKKEKMEGTN